jgi:hypothetical protein
MMVNCNELAIGLEGRNDCHSSLLWLMISSIQGLGVERWVNPRSLYLDPWVAQVYENECCKIGEPVSLDGTWKSIPLGCFHFEGEVVCGRWQEGVRPGIDKCFLIEVVNAEYLKLKAKVRESRGWTIIEKQVQGKVKRIKRKKRENKTTWLLKDSINWVVVS